MINILEKNNGDRIDTSVIIPSYKPIDYLTDCLCSLDDQKEIEFANLEVIVVLNGDIEANISFVKKTLLSLNNVVNFTIIYSKIQGVSRARNIGINISKGEYICFIDDDDCISSTYISELRSLASPNVIPLSNIHCFGNEISNTDNFYMTKIFKRLSSKKVVSVLDARSWFSSPVLKIIHKDLVGDIRFNEKISNGEDALFMYEIMKPKINVRLASLNAVYYRRVLSDSLVGKFRRKPLFQRVKHSINLSYLFLSIYLKDGFKHDFLFTLTRVLAPFKGLILK